MTFSLWQQTKRQSNFTSNQGRRRGRCRVQVEQLEARELPAVFAPFYVQEHPGAKLSPLASPGPTGLTPSQVRHAYGFDQITFPGSIPGDGRGTTIAIVDAYDDPNVASDLHQFDLQFGLPDPTFTKLNQNGGTALPAADTGWSTEIALDVEWAHAIAPKANILLVEASSSYDSDLFTAVQTAASQPGVAAVSMSWGGSEFNGQSAYDGIFSHAGVTFVVSSGDSGAPTSYPATSANVLAVGGTSLNLTAANTILSESGWSGSGGGISAYESQPSYQKNIVTQTTTKRANPDVAYDADPNTGFPVYDTYGSTGGWGQYGGTSDAAPQWAALIAIADQGRAAAGQAALNATSPTQALSLIYGLPATDFHDITTGISTGTPNYSATTGYDLVTGRGSPVANLVVSDLVGTSSTPSATSFTVAAAASVQAGVAFNVTVTAKDASGNLFSGYTGTVHLTTSDLLGVLPADYTFTTADKGSHTFTGLVLKTAASETVTATDSANNLTGSATVSITPAKADHLAFGQQPTTTAPTATISPAVTVQVLDVYNNLVTGDSTDSVALALGSNPGAATLTGGSAVTVKGGVATFSGLTVSKIGIGYTLTASATGLTGATSASFNVSSSTVLEDFESGLGNYYYVGYDYPAFYQSTSARHDGSYGLLTVSNNDWIFRNDSAAQAKAGDTLSVWVKFTGLSGSRAYFGFGASGTGALSLVAAPNSSQLILQANAGYGFANLATVSQNYQANHWYRLEVNMGTSGKIIGKLYDSNGTTVLKTITATTAPVTSGGIAFRGIGYNIYWDTVTVSHGVNTFLAPVSTGTPTSGSDGGQTPHGTHTGSSSFTSGLPGLGLFFVASTGQVPNPSTLVGSSVFQSGFHSLSGTTSTASHLGSGAIDQLFAAIATSGHASATGTETGLLAGEEWLAKLFGEG